jgi:hypothetical protein
MQVELTSLGITAWPGLQIQVQADGTAENYYGDAFPPALGLLRMGHRAVRTISLALLNTSALAVTVQGIYVVTMWRAPVAQKVLQGYALTTSEQAVARRTGVGGAAADQLGLLPIPLRDVLDRSYENRRISPVMRLSQAYTLQSTALTIFNRPTLTNQLQVITGVGAEASADEGATIIFSRDTDDNELILNCEHLSLDEPAPIWLPGTSSLTVQAAAVAPAGKVPILLDSVRLALSVVLRLRMGLMTRDDLAQLLAQQMRDQGVAPTKAADNAQSEAARIVDAVTAGKS